MESIVSKILNHSKPEELGQLENYLEKNQEVVLKNFGQLNQAIHALAGDVSAHTMGIVWLAAMRTQEKEENPVEGTIAVTEKLIKSGSYLQLRGFKSVQKRWRMLLLTYALYMREMRAFRRGIYYLKLAHKNFRPDDSHITPAASQAVMLALKGNNVRAVDDLLASHFLEVSPADTGVSATEYMSFYYYGAIAFVVQKKWQSALQFCETAMLVPASNASLIMVEAYKLYLLAGVIHTGTVLGLPAVVPYTSERPLKQLSDKYHDFCQACSQEDVAGAEKVMVENEKLFKKDIFWDLICQARNNMIQQKIRGLTRVFVTVSVKQMAATVGVSEAEVQKVLLEMVEEGTLNATITRTEGMVSFNDDEEETIEAAEEKIIQLRNLAQRIERLDDEVSLSETYLTDKLRHHPNYRQLLQEYEAKRKAARGVAGLVSDLFRGSGGTMGH